MMPGNGNGPLSVPPGFRFHPTDEELLYYYLKKKVSYEAIDLDVIREVDLNKLEPWDLKDRCRIGSGPQNEWYFFSHKDKKYPTGTRTNRATAAGFWKATGRDKAIFLGNTKRIGMRKTLVFYTGRAPHGHKTDWIMHEYRLNDDDPELQQEDGWVVCRVFKKKNHGRGLQHELLQDDDFENQTTHNHPSSNHHLIKGNNNGNSIASSSSTSSLKQHNNNNYNIQPLMFPSNNNYYNNNNNEYITSFDGTMHLPQLSNTDSIPQNAGQSLFTTMDNILRLSSNTSTNNGGLVNGQQLLGGGLTERLANNNGAEWGFLDKLLANYQGLEQHDASHNNKVAAANHQEIVGIMSSANNGLQHHHHAKFPFQYLGSDSDLLKFSK